MTAADHRARFRALHDRHGIFVMPNPWDIGSAKLLAGLGFEALATTSGGFALTLGRRDQQVTRDELVAHVRAIVAEVDLPLSVDSERLFGTDPAGVAETVHMLAAAGAAGCSIEDYDPATGAIDDIARATERVAAAAEAAHTSVDPMVLTARCENHLYGIDDLDDTIARLVSYADAGADCLYAPGLTQPAHIRAVVEAVGKPVNVLGLPDAPSVLELAELGVRRVSTGSLLADHAYAAMAVAARELLTTGTAEYGRKRLSAEMRQTLL